jgi:type II secretory pathway pseudopilin PulG
MASRQSGFTYVLLLWWVAISGVMLAALGEQWMMASRREREAEMVYRAEQIKQAIQAYNQATPAGKQPWPQRMEDLLEDRRGVTMKRHLRQKWDDPMARQDKWGEIRSGAFLKGVYSLAKGAPIHAPPTITSYKAWRFEAAAPPASASGAASGLATSAATAATPATPGVGETAAPLSP